MFLKGLKKVVVGLCAGFSLSAQAGFIDFTSIEWQQAIQTSPLPMMVNYAGVTIMADEGNLTFNANDNGGCVAGQATTGLACAGDGIGINNDEITQGGLQKLILTFDSAIDILDIHLLDLFGSEKTGEIAFIQNSASAPQSFKATPGNNGIAGGYWETGFTASGVQSLTVYSETDDFSDFALARIEFASVPEPGSIALMAFGLIGLVLARKQDKSNS